MRTILTLLLLSGGAFPAAAQFQDPFRHLLAAFERIDVDGDGVLSLAEYRMVQIARWPRIDRNGDSYLTLDDFPSVAAVRVRAQLAKVTYLDANGDGRISRAEFVNGQPLLFRRADRNGDGALTRSELESARRQD